MLTGPVGELPVVDDARWSASLTENSLIATIWWVVILAALLLAGLPWTIPIFTASPGGSGFARLIALLVSGYLVWILSSLEIIRFRAIWSGIALLAVGVSGWLLVLGKRRSTPQRRFEPRGIIGPELAFWTVFALFLALRLVNPDSWHPTWGGEKPMEFAHINAVLRSAHFPPYDPWFSDGLLNYYYYGEYLVAYLMKLSGIPSEIGFNLAQPTVMALLASGVYSVSTTLSTRLSHRTTPAWIGGVIGVIIVVLMGNLVVLRILLEAFPSIPAPTFDWTWAGSRAIPGGITEFPYFTGLYADLHAHVVALPVTVLVVAIGLELALRGQDCEEDSIRHRVQGAIVPVFLAALSLGTLMAANAWDVALYAALIATSVFMFWQRAKPVPLALALTGITAASVFGLAYLLFKPFNDAFVVLDFETGRIRSAGGVTDYIDLLARVRAGSALSAYMDHLGGLLALIVLGIAAWLVYRSASGGTVADSGHIPLLIVSIASIAAAVAAWLELENNWSTTATFLSATILAGAAVAGFILARFEPHPTSAIAIATVTTLAVLVAWRGWEVLAINLAVAVVGALLWMSNSEAAARFLGLLIAAGGFAAAGVEIVYVVDDLQTLEDWYRMNTVFKVYNEVWITLGLAASALVGSAFVFTYEALRFRYARSGSPLPEEASNDTALTGAQPVNPVPVVVAVISAIVIAAGLLYPLLATRPRLDQRFSEHLGPSTLNSLDWMNYGTIQSASGETIAFAEDRAVIEWLNANISGTPVIVEASIGPYRGNGSRISIATGLPAVIGWDRHERQQRPTPEILERNADVFALYNSTDPEQALQIIDRYRVAYIIVGEVERKTVVDQASGRTYASPEGLATLENMVGDSLEIAFRSGDTVVYRMLDS